MAFGAASGIGDLPERGLGVFGIVLILCGFALQSVQYWVALLNFPVK